MERCSCNCYFLVLRSDTRCCGFRINGSFPRRRESAGGNHGSHHAAERDEPDECAAGLAARGSYSAAMSMDLPVHARPAQRGGERRKPRTVLAVLSLWL